MSSVYIYTCFNNCVTWLGEVRPGGRPHLPQSSRTGPAAAALARVVQVTASVPARALRCALVSCLAVSRFVWHVADACPSVRPACRVTRSAWASVQFALTGR